MLSAHVISYKLESYNKNDKYTLNDIQECAHVVSHNELQRKRCEACENNLITGQMH